MSVHPRSILCLCLCLLALLVARDAAAAGRGLGLTVTLGKPAGSALNLADEVKLYGSSHALVIGNDRYTAGWPKLYQAVDDAKLVVAELERRGFDVTLQTDLDSDALEKSLREFFVLKGDQPDARLFLWFAGHGHTMEGEGFLVPTDAPLPEERAQFKLKALSMRRVGELVRLARAKHTLAVFDSCFSGTIFTLSRAVPTHAISLAMVRPVRQFLTSGDAGQEVSDDGRFAKVFVRALRGEETADANRDEFLTGTELGLFMEDRLTNLTLAKQTPRYGKLRDEDYDRGEFVFRILLEGAEKPAVAPEPAPSSGAAETAQRATASSPNATPSFDCSRATTPQEILFCSDRDLAAADSEMAAAYFARRRQLRGTDGAKRLLAAQRSWILERDVKCPAGDDDLEDPARAAGVVACLLAETRGRAQQLAALTTQ